ncbi:MAG: DUF983 domain-containing protein [Solirubrobacterales bacterium]
MTRIRVPQIRIPEAGPLPPPSPYHPPPLDRSKRRAIWRGFLRRCPRCGIGSVLAGYLTVAPKCEYCGEPLGHIRADDGPAYFTVLIVGHVVVPATLWIEQTWSPPLIPHIAGALVATSLLIWQLLPSVKGAMVGLMWSLGLKGDERQGDD